MTRGPPTRSTVSKSSSCVTTSMPSARAIYADPVHAPPNADWARPVEIRTPELVLRAFAVSDVPDLVAAFADEQIRRWNSGSLGTEGAEAFITARNDWSDGRHASWALAEPGGRLIGSVSVHKIDPDQRDAEIGYWIVPWARRRGHAARAVRAATDFAFAHLDMHRVQLFHATENVASCGVALAAGFPREGTLRQSFRYADGRYHDEHLHARLKDDPAG